MGAHLAREDLIVSVIVADRGKRRRVAVQRQRGERLAVAEEPSRQLGGDVLRVGGRASVAAHEQRRAARHRAGDEPHGVLDVGRQRVQGLRDVDVLVPDPLDLFTVAHLSVHVLTPGSTNVRLTS